MTHEEYRAAEGVSNSALKDIAEPSGCPALYFAKHIAKTCEQETSEAFTFGTVYHTAILEPDRLSASCYVRPEGDEGKFTTAAGKAWKKEHADRPIISQEEWVAIIAMRDAVYSNRKAKALLTGAAVEQSFFATDKNGIRRKCRVDIVPAKVPNALADLKSMRSVYADNFNKDSEKFRYFVQGAWYSDIFNMLNDERNAFAFICQEKTPPYLVAVHELAPEVIQAGRKVYQRDLAVLSNCLETGNWPGPREVVGGLTERTVKQMQQDGII